MLFYITNCLNQTHCFCYSRAKAEVQLRGSHTIQNVCNMHSSYHLFHVVLISFNSRSYAEDVTSVTSGASQGPHSFNLVFVCVFVCVTPGAIPYLSRTVPYQQRQLATIFLFVCAIDMPGAIPYLYRTIKSTVPSRE